MHAAGVKILKSSRPNLCSEVQPATSQDADGTFASPPKLAILPTIEIIMTRFRLLAKLVCFCALSAAYLY
jgi:hypothetical protein